MGSYVFAKFKCFDSRIVNCAKIKKMSKNVTSCIFVNAIPLNYFEVYLSFKTKPSLLKCLQNMNLNSSFFYIFSEFSTFNTDDKNKRKVCFEDVTSYSTAFLFFVETETTVGYGSRSITANCPEAILLLIIQVTKLTLLFKVVDSKTSSKLKWYFLAKNLYSKVFVNKKWNTIKNNRTVCSQTLTGAFLWFGS